MAGSIADWLRELGLDQYAQAFADNDIDHDVLAELTAEDLTGLGVTSIGHRRKLLAAIKALRESQETNELSPAVSLAEGAAASSEVADVPGAERRLLTIMPFFGCPFRKFDPARIRVVRQNHRMVRADADNPVLAWNVRRRLVQVAAPSTDECQSFLDNVIAGLM